MNSKKNYTINDIPAFQGLVSSEIEDLISQSEILSYSIGQPLANRRIRQDKILLLLNGQGRLLGQENNNNYTVCMLSTGSLIGLGSFLSASSCEEVIASNDLKVLAIPDTYILDLYNKNKSFKAWCNKNILPAELQTILEIAMTKLSSFEFNPKQMFKELIQESLVETFNTNSVITNKKGYIPIIGSDNCINKSIGEAISSTDVVETRGDLPCRIIYIKEELYKKLTNKNNQISKSNIPNTSNIELSNKSKTDTKSGPNFPNASKTDLGEYKKNQIRLIKGNGILRETFACIQMLSETLELPFRKDAIEKILQTEIKNKATATIDVCGGIATMMGLTASKAAIPSKLANRLTTPSLVSWKGSISVIAETSKSGILLASPKEGWVQINSEDLEDEFPNGLEALLIEKTSFTPEKKFGLSWFWPSLKKHKGVLIQVLIASFVVQLFTLANPLLIQVIIDKVINQRSLDTLQILGIALVVVTILGGVIGSLRTFLFTETTNRIDVRLGSEVIDHLLRLPLNYFDRRPVGELASRVSELEKIRNFLTGQALTTILDAAFSLIYIIVMLLYSWLLTAIALIVLPIQIGIILIGTPLIRRQVRETAVENAKTQSHLVEVLTGVQTVKAQNVETVSRWKWQLLYNKYIARTFERTITGTALNESSQVFQQLSQLLVLWVGASLVLKGQMSLGQLIAFKIISSYVTQPILRLSTIWQNIQELKVSFDRLADIVDHNEESIESDKANIPLPKIIGNIEFKNVSFRFNTNSPAVLNRVSLEVKSGEFIGIVGQSGSGKSTLMKLLPRLYIPNEGQIKVDNYDINKVELYSLRRQIGIVPQDPLLFSGTINENIALTNPKATSEQIVNAAKTASAHEFIMDLPQGYSTNVGERGASLSGGQRQRIAIARTILNQPNMLIMDEATSALDYANEKRVCDNLKKDFSGQTVFFITHRLSSIKNADRILMMHEGSIVEQGTHQELMTGLGRYYALYKQQESS